MVYDPSIGNVAWPGGPPLGALAAIQAQEAQAAEAAARVAAERMREAKEAMRASGATCELECRRSDGTDGPCAVPAVGRCATCHRAFCDSHQSVYRSEPAGGTVIIRPVSMTECRECQDREIQRAAQDARTVSERAEARRRAEEAQRRAERERVDRDEREHAALVAEWEEGTGWAKVAAEVDRLNVRIAKLQQRGSRRRLRSYLRDRDVLLEARGCGDPRCNRCQPAAVICARLVGSFLAAMRAAGNPGATPSWTGHSAAVPTLNPGSRTGSSHLRVRYSLSVDVRGGWTLSAHYTQPPSMEISSHLLMTGGGNERAEQPGSYRAGTGRDTVTIVLEILTNLAVANGVPFP